MKALRSWALPIVLGVVGLALIIVASFGDGDGSGPSLPPIATGTPVAEASPTSEPTKTPDEPDPTASGTSDATPSPEPTPTPLPDDVVAQQIEVPSVGINVGVRQSSGEEDDRFPPSDSAFILSNGHQPGRNTNAYVFAHALNSLFKPLWNVQPGAEVLVRMSDGTVLEYVVTEVRPNVACPDPRATENNPPDPPLALQIHDTCDEGLFWTAPTPYERLTLQTSQGYNRNWGELVVIAEPTG